MSPLIKAGLNLYSKLILVAVGDLVGANLAGVLGMILASENKAEVIRPWTEWGWIIGTGLSVIGALTGRLRFINGQLDRISARSSNDNVDSEQESIISVQNSHSSESNTELKQTGFFSAVAFFGFIGGLLGSILGGTFLLFWFSLAYSPIAPAGWAGDVKVEREVHLTGTNTRRSILKTDNAVAIRLFLVPALIGGAIGAVAGGVGSARGKIYDT
ncbi:MAG TPA: hypothetical protein VLA12_13485 [Planctomycetaceae bacterium]|nr:hypothetical protein [Planctomycetaceae bacterium]